MKNTAILSFVSAILLLTAVSCNCGANCESGDSLDSPPVFESFLDSTSYIIGVNMGADMKASYVEVDPMMMAKGVEAALNGTGSVFTDKEKEDVMAEFQARLQKRQTEQKANVGQENITKGQEFMAANKGKEGVMEHPSGIQYKILKAGDNGGTPTMESKVTVHYRGTLLDGSEFDSSFSRGEPVTFDLTGLIQGWQIAIPMMSVGSKWELYIPATLAYGDRGYAPKIGPHETLIFQIELFAFE